MNPDELKHVQFRRDGGVAVVTLNRPDALNALNVATIDELNGVMDVIAADETVRAVLITGAGRAFCAGADVKEWDSHAEPEGESWVPRMHRFMTRLHWLPKPVIAAVNGVAVGAGCDLTLVADIRLASTSARFGEVYIKLGFCPDAGGSYLLPKLIGESRASELIYTGRIIDAQEAGAIGLVSHVVEPDLLLSTAMELAQRLASGPTVAIGIAKQNIRANRTETFEQALRNELRGGDVCGATKDHTEGLRAVVDRRAPVFAGR